MDRTREFFDRLISWSPVLLMGGLAALTYWLDAQIQPASARRHGSTRHDPDLFLEHFRAINFDVDGKPRETLEARRGEHFPDDNSALLFEPMFRITQPDKPPFTVTADRGTISGDREHAYFTGNVHATRDAETGPSAKGTEQTGAISLATEYLHVIPKTERAETDRRVTIKEARGIIESVGLELDNQKKTLKFKSRVNGTFEPQAIKK